MNLLPYRRFTIITILSQRETAERIAAELEPAEAPYNIDIGILPMQYLKEYRGYVTSNSFSLKRNLKFSPFQSQRQGIVIKGKISGTPTGTAVSVVVKPVGMIIGIAIQIVLCLLCLFAIFVFISAGFFAPLLLPFIILLISTAYLHIQLNVEYGMAVSFLNNLLEENI